MLAQLTLRAKSEVDTLHLLTLRDRDSASSHIADPQERIMLRPQGYHRGHHPEAFAVSEGFERGDEKAAFVVDEVGWDGEGDVVDRGHGERWEGWERGNCSSGRASRAGNSYTK